jgi:hypothetical protein
MCTTFHVQEIISHNATLLQFYLPPKKSIATSLELILSTVIIKKISILHSLNHFSTTFPIVSQVQNSLLKLPITINEMECQTKVVKVLHGIPSISNQPHRN